MRDERRDEEARNSGIPGLNSLQSLEIPPFRITKVERQQPGASRLYRWMADAVATLEWERQRQRFVVAYKARGSARQVDEAIEQTRAFIGENPNLAPMVVAPYLSQSVIDRLIEARISAVDLSGNYAIVVPGKWLVVRTGARNKYRDKTTIKNIYRGMSSLVCRALVLKGEFESTTSLWNELRNTRISLPTVSKVLKALEEDLIIERRKRVAVLQPAELLQRLVDGYRPPRIRRRILGKIGLDPETLSRINSNATASGVTYALDRPEDYTVLPSTDRILRIYASTAEGLLSGLAPDTLSRFPNIEVIETVDPRVYYDLRRGDGWAKISPLQAYLELRTAGKREQEAASTIEAGLLQHSYR